MRPAISTSRGLGSLKRRESFRGVTICKTGPFEARAKSQSAGQLKEVEQSPRRSSASDPPPRHRPAHCRRCPRDPRRRPRMSSAVRAAKASASARLVGSRIAEKRGLEQQLVDIGVDHQDGLDDYRARSRRNRWRAASVMRAPARRSGMRFGQSTWRRAAARPQSCGPPMGPAVARRIGGDPI